MPGALPMRGGAAAIEQSGLGEDIGAGTDAGGAPRGRRRLANKAQDASVERRRAAALATGDDQGVDPLAGVEGLGGYGHAG